MTIPKKRLISGIAEFRQTRLLHMRSAFMELALAGEHYTNMPILCNDLPCCLNQSITGEYLQYTTILDNLSETAG
jgi:hypothetical protein